MRTYSSVKLLLANAVGQWILVHVMLWSRRGSTTLPVENVRCSTTVDAMEMITDLRLNGSVEQGVMKPLVRNSFKPIALLALPATFSEGTCSYGGGEVEVGGSIPADDGCNTWLATSHV